MAGGVGTIVNGRHLGHKHQVKGQGNGKPQQRLLGHVRQVGANRNRNGTAADCYLVVHGVTPFGDRLQPLPGEIERAGYRAKASLTAMASVGQAHATSRARSAPAGPTRCTAGTAAPRPAMLNRSGAIRSHRPQAMQRSGATDNSADDKMPGPPFGRPGTSNNPTAGAGPDWQVQGGTRIGARSLSPRRYFTQGVTGRSPGFRFTAPCAFPPAHADSGLLADAPGNSGGTAPDSQHSCSPDFPFHLRPFTGGTCSLLSRCSWA